MRYPAEETAERHERALDAASRMMRQRGLDGVSVVEVMRAAGLTHGAFPAHFSSKDAMITAGLERALTDVLALIARAEAKADPLAAFAASYLSAHHRDNPERGCVIATLAPEITRKGGDVRTRFTNGVAEVVDRMASTLFRRYRGARRASAIAALATLVGAMTLARAVDDPDFSSEILDAARSQFGIASEATS